MRVLGSANVVQWISQDIVDSLNQEGTLAMTKHCESMVRQRLVNELAKYVEVHWDTSDRGGYELRARGSLIDWNDAHNDGVGSSTAGEQRE
jgi:hypothetical protein